MDQSPEQRKYKRVPYNEDILINDSLEVLCDDISEGGLFINLNRSLLPGSTVNVTFPKRDLKVEAMVQAVPETGGVGLMFTSLSPAELAIIMGIIEQAEAAHSQRQIKPTVLMVEDSKNLREIHRLELVAQGFEVMETARSDEALRILSTQRPVAVLLNRNMEKEDGFNILESLNQSGKLAGIPVVVLTSTFDSDDKAKLREAGASAVLPKLTTTPGKLVSVIKKLVKN
jgi:CheY-like chemotaxis protein